MPISETDTEITKKFDVPPTPLATGAYDPINVNIAQVDSRRGLAEIVNLTDDAISLSGWSIEVNGDLRPLSNAKTLASGAVLPVALKESDSNLQLTLRNAAGAIVQQIETRDGRINRAPMPLGQTKWSVEEGQEFTTKLQVEDKDHNWLQYELIRAPRGLIMDLSGTIHWQPGEAAGPGTETVEIAVDDGESPMGRVVFQLEFDVAEINEKPQLQAVGDQAATIGQPWSLQLTARDADLPRQELTWMLVDGPDHMTLENGLLSWTPPSVKEDQVVPVAVQVSDDVGGIAIHGFTILVRGTVPTRIGPEDAESNQPVVAAASPEAPEPDVEAATPDAAKETPVEAPAPKLVATEVIEKGTIVVTEVIDTPLPVVDTFKAGFLGGGVAGDVFPVASTIRSSAEVLPVALGEPITTGIVHGEIISGGFVTSEAIGIAPWEAVATPTTVIRFP